MNSLVHRSLARVCQAFYGLVLLGLGSLAFAHSSSLPPLKTVARVDLDRYQGRWYEIARYPNRFQAQCVGQVTADYAQLPQGGISVINRCATANGQSDETAGRARVVDSETQAKLEVRFAPAWLSWLPFVWGDYWVIDLAPDYSYAVVGEPERRYLWVLSRTPALPEAVWLGIAQRLLEQGYDPARLVRTLQP